MSKIDFVITWVDDSDEEWQNLKQKHIEFRKDESLMKAMTADKAFRDWDTLKYWFRSVERYAPWVNKIFFVTYGHTPEWLYTMHEKLVIIKHDEFIPQDALPTFNSRAIEVNFHRIKQLSNQFVYFNDDFFLNDYVSKNDFFLENVPKESAILSPVIPIRFGTSAIQINNMEIVNYHFSKEDSIRENLKKWFSLKYRTKLIRNVLFYSAREFVGFFEPHIPTSFCKETYKVLWEKEKEILLNTTNSTFKQNSNVNQWLFRYWQIAEGNFIPRKVNFGKYYELSSNNIKLFEDIETSMHKVICINDTFQEIDFRKVQKELLIVLNNKYPNKSSFEKGD